MSTMSVPMATERVEVKVGDGRMLAYVARPPRPAKNGPGIVVLQEAFGVTGYLREVTARFANELGFTAIAPELYHRTGDGVVAAYDSSLPKDSPHRKGISEEGITADVVAAYEWLTREGIAADRCAAVGFCMGGRAAFLGNAQVPLRAAISFYGTQIAPGALSLAAKQHGPLLFFWPGRDHSTTLEQRRAVQDALTAADSVAHAHVDFSDAEHGFFCHARQSTYRADYSAQAWAMLVEFLRAQNLGV
jgi:carboxymethylenebutenolidase